MRKILLLSIALVASLAIVLSTVTPVTAVLSPNYYYSWYGSGGERLYIDLYHNNYFSFSNGVFRPIDFSKGDPRISAFGNGGQPYIFLEGYGLVSRQGMIVRVRWDGKPHAISYETADGMRIYQFTAVGQIGGKALVRVVCDSNHDGVKEIYSFSLNWLGFGAD